MPPFSPPCPGPLTNSLCVSAIIWTSVRNAANLDVLIHRGLTSASEQHAHRSMNYETMKTGNAVKPKAPKVPSDVNVEHTYGIPSTHIPLEVYRVCGYVAALLGAHAASPYPPIAAC